MGKAQERAKKRKAVTLDDSEDEDSDQGHKGKSFASIMACADILRMNVQCSRL